MNYSDVMEAATGQRNAMRLEISYVHADQRSEIYSMRGVMYGYDVWFYVQVWEMSLPDVWVCLNKVSFNKPSQARDNLFRYCVSNFCNWSVSYGALIDHCSEEEFTMAALEVFL